MVASTLCERCGEIKPVMTIMHNFGSNVLEVKRGDSVCEECAWLCQDCQRQSVSELGDTLCEGCSRALKYT